MILSKSSNKEVIVLVRDMNNICEKTLGDCWISSVCHVMHNGSEHFDEDIEIKEVLGLSLRITEPNSKDAFIQNVGDQKVIKNMLKKFSKGVRMPNRQFTYGELLYEMNGVDQVDWLVERIKEKRETKSASICLLKPGDCSLQLPCLTTVDLKLRQEKLHLQFFFRSQNVFGRQYANLLALADLQEKISTKLQVMPGCMSGYIASAHIYAYDFNAAISLSERSLDKADDLFYTEGPRSIRMHFDH